MGGAESQVVNLADEFVKKGHHVTLAYLVGPVLMSPNSNKIDVVWLKGDRNILGFLKAFFYLNRLVTSLQPDVVHSHMFHANILARLARLFTTVPRLVSTAHSNNEGGKFRMLAYRVTDGLAHEFTNVSQGALDSFERKKAAPLGRMIATPNGIDTQRFNFRLVSRQRLRSELGLQNRKVFIAIGRFHEAKDYPNLLDAFSIFCENESTSHLVIVGDGELRPEIEERMRTLGLDSKVSLLGVRKDVPELLSAADFFVLSSAWEGFGLVVAEAMSTERVVIATDSGGVAEVLGGNGFLVPPRDSKALAKGMQKAIDLSNAEAKEFGRKSRQHVVEMFSLNRTVSRWLEIYAHGY
ncbi:glycosyltransferase [Pseudomonas sp. 5Ae-yellow]|uniref:glycosyltransferase n=1 Tax=Pseudomonas sp. 5Ae-yellow TaxID=2759848 RepID=UPI0015F3D4E9|nr:glycosyltransferase [Pseudomonas sp. 5Ae-yellow]MBA6420855.1 glycosyltransferase [Pseudomonas sp. 5Ae-yellow]